MIQYLRYLLQLILAPGPGWADVRRQNPDPVRMLHRGLYPLLAIAAATEFLAFVYTRHASLGVVLMRAVSDFGSYFIAVFIARLIFELYLGRLVIGGEAEPRRTENLTVCGIGLMVIMQIVTNCVPWNLVLLKFLPVYVILVLYKAGKYMRVKKNREMRFTGLAAAAIVGVPLAIYYLLYLIIR